MAEVGAVLAFYRRELAARNWKEETQGAVLNPKQVEPEFLLGRTERPRSARRQIRPNEREHRTTACANARQSRQPAAESRTRHPKATRLDALMKQSAANGARGHLPESRPASNAAVRACAETRAKPLAQASRIMKPRVPLPE